jgi:peptide/nickel transport system substrate-binding protein
MQSKFILFILIGFLCSCNKLSNIDSNKTVFRYNESKGITSLDPAFARSLPLIWPVHQIFNGLIQLSDSLTVEPCIAHSWIISEDGLQYTFNLRTDVKFHSSEVFDNENGRRVVASDFVYSFGRIIDPTVASPGAWIFSVLDKNKPNTINGCRAKDDSTLIVYLSEPFPAFLGLLSMPYAYVVPQEAVEFYERNFRRNPVGTGPFQLKYWREGEKLVLEKNPNYFELDKHGNRLPYLDAVSITFIADKQSEFLEFLLGNIDYLSGIHAVSKDELLTRSGNLNPKYNEKIRMLTGPYLNTEYLGILVDSTLDIVNNNNPLNIKEVRMAIGYGFDRVRMMAYLRSNMGYAATNGFVPKGMPGFSDSVEGFYFNPDLSRELLATAGFPSGVGLPTISLSTTDDYVDICEFIQHQLADVGININVEVFPGAAYREMMANSRMLFFRGSWVADYADPENYLSLFYTPNFSPNGPNYTHFSNKRFDNLYNKALWQPNDSLRYMIYNKMDSTVIANAVVIPLYYDKVVRFVSKDVLGMQTNPMNLLSLKHVKKTTRNDSNR